eukprot:TRINITY_DN80603_c0_g1_i1.p1 TRINITY_DN80603_c0_g1~~TRINITY_DN80603_c0_g1_i1.p1  ORF type:complete len:398 (-),score=78.80 TRINITY_DN80603_c0_g1_i1:182-1321(-)
MAPRVSAVLGAASGAALLVNLQQSCGFSLSGQPASSVSTRPVGQVDQQAAARGSSGNLRGAGGVRSGLAKTVACVAVAAACLGARSLRRSARNSPKALVAMAARGGDEEDPPAIIIGGGGRLGDAFYRMGTKDIIVKRGDPFPADAPRGPIYVCTRNDALAGIVASVPQDRHEDLVFVQNGALLPFIDRELAPGLPITVLLVYFAVAKLGDEPLDGKTDTDPDGLSAVNDNGKWAVEVQKRLTSSGLACRRLVGPSFTQAYWEKNLWIAAYMVVGALHDGCKVGDVESSHREEVDDLISELATGVTAVYPEVQWERGQLCERLAAYARSVAHFPTAVKEFEWRNGPFYDLSLKAEAAGRADPCPTHTAALKKLGIIPAA